MLNKICYLALILGFVACSKEEDTEIATTNTTNTIPSISLSQPVENHTVGLGQTFSLEGLVTDAESLAAIHYSIESPSASYNYTASNSITASGTNTDFNNNVLIPASASVGPAVLKIYCTDTENNQSSTITRNITIADNIEPIITYLNDSVTANDMIELKVYKNLNNIVDSAVVFNQTTSENLAIITDFGGFRSIQRGGNSGTIFHLLNNFQNSYSYQLSSSTGAWLYFNEHDDSPGTYTALKLWYY